MTKIPRLAVVGAAAFLGAAVAHAQTAQTPPPTPRPAVPAATQTTITGCVERADQMASATTSTTTDSQSFVLIKESPSSAAGSSTAAVGTSGSTEKPIKYKLDGESATINPHVGHKVEVTGTVEGDSSAADPAASPKLKVSSIKMVSATCAR